MSATHDWKACSIVKRPTPGETDLSGISNYFHAKNLLNSNRPPIYLASSLKSDLSDV